MEGDYLWKEIGDSLESWIIEKLYVFDDGERETLERLGIGYKCYNKRDNMHEKIVKDREGSKNS